MKRPAKRHQWKRRKCPQCGWRCEQMGGTQWFYVPTRIYSFSEKKSDHFMQQGGRNDARNG